MRNLLNGREKYQTNTAEMARYYGLRQLAPDLHKTVREGGRGAVIQAIQTLQHFRDTTAAPVIVERLTMPETDASLALAGMEALITLGSLDAIRDFTLAENEDVAIAAMNTIARLNDCLLYTSRCV